jgi:hypothetical protein
MPQSETIAEIEVLRTQLTDNIDGFRAAAKKNKKRALQLRISIVCFGSLTTLLIGLKSNLLFSEYDNEFSALALLASALIPVLSALDAFIDPRWLWVRHTAAQTSLVLILDELNYAAAKGSLSGARLDSFHDEVERIIKEAADDWLSKRSKTTEGALNKAPPEA